MPLNFKLFSLRYTGGKSLQAAWLFATCNKLELVCAGHLVISPSQTQKQAFSQRLFLVHQSHLVFKIEEKYNH